MEVNKQTMRQIGVIVFGADIVARTWIEQAQRDGYAVLLTDNRAELYTPIKG